MGESLIPWRAMAGGTRKSPGPGAEPVKEGTRWATGQVETSSTKVGRDARTLQWSRRPSVGAKARLRLRDGLLKGAPPVKSSVVRRRPTPSGCVPQPKPLVDRRPDATSPSHADTADAMSCLLERVFPPGLAVSSSAKANEHVGLRVAAPPDRQMPCHESLRAPTSEALCCESRNGSTLVPGLAHACAVRGSKRQSGRLPE